MMCWKVRCISGKTGKIHVCRNREGDVIRFYIKDAAQRYADKMKASGDGNMYYVVSNYCVSKHKTKGGKLNE